MGKYALIIGNTEYDDPLLARLKTPTNNVEKLGGLLADPQIGGYQIKALANADRHTILDEVDLLFRNKSTSDLLLLYFAGHGVLDSRGKLYLAVKETERDRPRVTAISAQTIKEIVEDSDSDRIVLCLDCCYAGAFMPGQMSASIGMQNNAEQALLGGGDGRVILAATDRTSVAWEGEKI